MQIHKISSGAQQLFVLVSGEIIVFDVSNRIISTNFCNSLHTYFFFSIKYITLSAHKYILDNFLGLPQSP